MKKLITVSLALASTIFLSTPSLPNIAYADENKPSVSIDSPSAILINAENGDILYEKNSDKNYDIASVTKVMTLSIISEQLESGKIKLDDKVEISQKAWQTGGSKMFLEVGEKWPVKELINGIAIVSGNDASVAMAEHVAGSTEEFAKMMNKKAKELKMNNTTFYSPNGLGLNDNKHFDTSTAKDLALLAKYYINKYPNNMKIHSSTTYITKTRTHKIEQHNSNPLLGNYKGANGIKTGMINGNYNIIGSAQRDKTKLIAIVLGSKTASQRGRDTANLLDFGFSQYKTVTKGEKGEELVSVPVYRSDDSNEAKLVLKENLSFVVHVDHENDIVIKDEIPSYIKGGTKAGEVLGKRIVTVDGKRYEADITIKKDIGKAGFIKSFFDSIAMFFQWSLDTIFN